MLNRSIRIFSCNRRGSNFLIYALVTGLTFLFLHTELKSETQTIEIIHADRLTQRTLDNQQVRILTGNVRLKQDEVIMACDSAVQYIQDNNLEAFDNIHIRQGDSLHLYGDHLFYEGQNRLATLEHNVRMEEDDMVLYTDKLYYEVDDGVAYYHDFAEIHEGENKLTSIIGYYFSGNKELHFKDSVRLYNPDFTLSGDTLVFDVDASVAHAHGPTYIDQVDSDDFLYCERGWYNTENETARIYQNAFLRHESAYLYGDTLYLDRKLGYGNARMNVHLRDTVENTDIYGHFAEYFEDREYAYFTDSASVRTVEDEDTLWLAADTLVSMKDDTGEHRMFKAYHNVVSFNRNFQASCDSAVYNDADSLLTMYHQPRVWLDSQQISGDTIMAKLHGEDVHRIFVRQRAFLTEPLGFDFYNQIKGRNMKGFFRNNELYRIDVTGNAEGIYFLQDEDEQFIGVNRMEASDIRIFFQNREISDITFVRAPDAKVYPMGHFRPADLRLQGFNWTPERMPSRPEQILHAYEKLEN